MPRGPPFSAWPKSDEPRRRLINEMPEHGVRHVGHAIGGPIAQRRLGVFIMTDRTATASRRHSLRVMALLGSALGSTIGVDAASAQTSGNIAYNGAGPYTLTQTTPVSGGPRAIDVIVTSGDATVDTSATTVATSNTGNTTGAGVAVNNTGSGNTTIRNGNVTATGTGRSFAVDGRTTTGTDTIVNGGVINASGNNGDYAIVAIATTGDIAITSNEAHGQLRGIYTFTNGTTTINSTTVTADGTGLANAIIGQGNRVVINSGTASNTNAGGNGGTAIFANSDVGGVLVNAQNTSAYGQNQAAIQVFSNGAVDVTSGTILTTQNSDGLSLASGTDVVARSTSITTQGAGGARGIVVGGNAGGGGFNSGTNGFAYNSATITSGSISTVGTGAYGIYVTPNGAGATAITSGAITTTGAGAYGIYETAIGNGQMTGPSTINSTGLLKTSGANADAINVAAGTGTVTIANSGTVAVAGAGSNGIYVNGTSQATNITSNLVTVSNGGGYGIFVNGGPTTIASSEVDAATGTGIYLQGTGASSITSGTVKTTGTQATAINVTSDSLAIASTTITGGGYGINAGATGTGDTTINSGSIALGTVAPGRATSLSGYGITAIESGTGNLTVTSGSVSLTGAGNTFGIQGQAGGGGNLAINSGTVSVVGNGGYGILGSSSSGAVTITATGNTTTTGTTRAAGGQTDAASQRYADGIDALSLTGAISVTNGGTISTSGATARGIDVEAGRAKTTFGAAGTTVSTAALSIVNTGMVNTTGATANAINVASDANTVTIASNAVSTTGAGSIGINVGASTGATSIASTNATTSGAGANAINAVATTGAITINGGTVGTTGTSSRGIYAQATTGNIVINATTVTTTGAYDPNNGTPSDAVTAFNTATGAGTIVINTGTTAAAGQYASAVFAAGGGAVSITSGTASASGANTDVIGGVSGTSDVTINAGSTSASGVGGEAIGARAGSGNVTVTAAMTTATGGNAISATAGKIASVTAGTATGGGDGASGVVVTGGTGVMLAIGAASSNGTAVSTTNTRTGVVTTTRADAILATATTGMINATIGSATATGAGADAIRLIAAGTGGGVTATITGMVSSSSGNGLFIDPPGANTVTIANGASVTGATAGINAAGATNSIVNLGMVSSSGGPGILAAGTTTLDNSGTISGANGVAVQLGATDDTVILRTGSVVAGQIIGGGGTDAAVLIGTNGAATATQQVATFTGFDHLTVQSGYWTAPASNGTTVNQTTIANGAAFEVANGANGISGYASPVYADNGTLVVRSSGASAGSTFGTSVVTGTGGVSFVGTGTATLDGLNSLQNTGTNTVAAGSTVLVTGTQGGTFVNNGTIQVGTGGTSGNLTGNVTDNGTLIVNRADTYSFNGALTGTGTLIKQGDGQVVFGSNYAFTGTTQLNGGSIRLSTPVAATTMLDAEGTGTYDLSGNAQTIAQLSGASAGAVVNIDNGALTVNQSTTTSFAGSLIGNGTLTKTGTGSLNLTGNSTYTGPTTINGGRLAVNGSITSPVVVNSGGTLGGNGTVGSTMIASGGTFAPGNSIGTTTVAGNVVFAAGSIYQVEANATGGADRINATGTATLAGGTVQVLAATGSYAPLTSYTILTATGGVTGKFTTATSNMAFLTPFLTYGTNAVTLQLGRNDISFASEAGTPNGVSVANAIAGRGLGDTIFNTILVQTAASAGTAFNELSGEIHATVETAMIDSDRGARDAMMDHARLANANGLGLWMQPLDTYAQARHQGPAFGFHTNRIGVYGGIDYAFGGVRIGVSGGYLDDKLRVPALASRAEIETDLIGGSISYAARGGRLTAIAGATHAWHHVDTTRIVDVTGLAGSYAARYNIKTTQAFGELGFNLLQGPVAVTPFVRYDYDWSRADGFNEIGGPAALNVAAERRHTEFGTAGVRIAAAFPLGSELSIEPHASAAYLRTWDQLASTRLETFGGTGPGFTVTGDRLGRDNLDANAGMDLVVSPRLRIGVAGYTTRSNEWRDYGAKGSVSVRF